VANLDVNRRSSYLERLPALFQEGDAEFLGRLLLGFEHVLSGLGDVDDPGLEEVLDGAADPDSGRVLAGVERHFDPGVRAGRAELAPEQRAPAEFLEWLAGWVGVALRSHMTENQRREMVARAVALYRKRGTREGLEQLLAVQSGLKATITDAGSPRRDGAPDLSDKGPHYFHVEVSMSDLGGPIDVVKPLREILTAILDAEKPAHTTYDLDFKTVELQVGKTSHVGVDTLIGKPKYAEHN
jgi:phage tail-like protein